MEAQARESRASPRLRRFVAEANRRFTGGLTPNGFLDTPRPAAQPLLSERGKVEGVVFRGRDVHPGTR
jgi:hypothetical protein